MASFSVLVPTYRRPDDLRKCLLAIKGQSVPAMEVIVVRRDTDLDTKLVITQYQDLLPIIEVVVSEPGVVHAMNKGIAVANAEFVAITDDDAEPAPDWLLRLERHFEALEEVAGVGGRDIVTIENNGIVFKPQEKVGLITKTGRIIGGHHCGVGEKRSVDVLKGVNCAYRRTILQSIGFDSRLLGNGAQTHWEISLCRSVIAAGYKLIYDPSIIVIHNIGVRHDEDKRTNFNPQAFYNNAHNELLALGTKQPRLRMIKYFVFASFVGHKTSPGLLYSIARLVIKREFNSIQKFALASKARWTALLASLQDSA